MSQATLLETATYPKLTDLDSVIAACGERPDVQPFARIVGKWVWAEFPAKPTDDVRDFLKGTGFRWNKERAAWQHSCGHFARRNAKIDPRAYYGQSHIEQDTTTREAAGAPTIQRDHDRLSRELSAFQSI
jgi:hypothetical protein